MSETEFIFVLVLTSVGIIAGFTGDFTAQEKIFLIASPLLMWFLWRRLFRQLRRRRIVAHDSPPAEGASQQQRI